ncbi:mannose-6-phosphate isomerase, class I [Planctomonas sp. JC2975]|uniref:mannose-6-phosphate isomerase, class I n=1 Tax=Planctomonas sp. JC2975 TaxID=2729626 RepID=UPI001474BD98|nr:mannose-6-phosphate isomerase, class I [Planctomonas sp. JC2975]NNC13088.1 mannose-6-phosphate isomerase, class I [Planctomonas sp. JC2975]
MFVRIDNVPRDYAWGSSHGIADLLGRPASGGPEAELWLGAHPGSPSFLVHPTTDAGTLADLIAEDPAATLGDDWPAEESYDGRPRLGFLLKVLSAASPLSIQAHPSPEQARAGFDRENRLGIPMDSPERNYKDPFHKPELIYAVTPFDALCGFRDLATSIAVFDRLIATGRSQRMQHDELDVLRGILLAGEDDESALRAAVGLLLGGGEAAEEIVAQATAIARSPKGESVPELGVVSLLADAYPGDPGVVLALLLHRVALAPGEALYLPAGNIHAYLKGTGIELMAASDNVLRGGLTPKHIDVPELLRVLDFAPVPAPLLAPSRVGALDLFEPDVPDFRLAHVTADSTLTLNGPAIVLATAGAATLSGASGTANLTRGEAVYVSPDEGSLAFTLESDTTLFVATENR